MPSAMNCVAKTSWQATTFLVGEYVEGEIRDNPVFTVSDGLIWLYQSAERNSVVRCEADCRYDISYLFAKVFHFVKRVSVKGLVRPFGVIPHLTAKDASTWTGYTEPTAYSPSDGPSHAAFRRS